MIRYDMCSGWKIRQVECDWVPDLNQNLANEDWICVPAMPQMIHTVLNSAGLIDEPWQAGKAEECRWVSEADWAYGVTFDMPTGNPPYILHCGGVDTIAEVYLNGVHLHTHANAYQPFDVDVTSHLSTQNSLFIVVRSPFETVDGNVVPKNKTQSGLTVRRPNLNYGTYIGPHPYFSRMGIYGKVSMISVDGGSIDRLLTTTSLDETCTTGAIVCSVSGSVSEPGLIRLVLTNDQGNECRSVERDISGGSRFDETVTCEMDSPDLWWPRGYGDQRLYGLSVQLVVNDDVIQTERRTIGFRRVEMPEPLHFTVNGKNVRLWGGNWVAPDWVTAVPDPKRRERLFDLAENAHFNAFRVWGVGIGAEDAMYEEADRRGFMIWQDFHDLPLEPGIENEDVCQVEAIATIERLAHHPSIFLWCGGNEADQWNDTEFGGPGGEWPGKHAAEHVVGDVCKRLDPERYYHPNSPYYGMDANDPTQWDTHGYTNLWWIPGYEYLTFATEDTRIAAPPIHSVLRFMAPEDVWPDDYSPLFTPGDTLPWPDSWMKYTTSKSEWKTGPVELFYDAADAESLVYRLGMAECLYYRDTIERQRRGRAANSPTKLPPLESKNISEDGQTGIVSDLDPRRCGGYLVWKFNDSWPQIYSGKVDYFLEPYHAYYELKRAYAPVLVSIDMGVFVWVWIVNDSAQPIDGVLRVRLFHIDRNEIDREITRNIYITPDGSIPALRLDQEGIGVFDRQHLISAEFLTHEGEVTARSIQCADIERRTCFPNATIAASVVEGDLILTTDRYARSVTLQGDADGDAFGWFFDDNYFDLLPWEEKRIKILGEKRRGMIRVKPFYADRAVEVLYPG